VYYDQVAQIVLPRWSRHRVVLVGDAGYAVSLLAGQGASLAVGGAYVLAEQLATGPALSTPRCAAMSSCGGRWPRRNSKSPAAGSAGFFRTRGRSCGHDTS
jgi:flavin-dependent dehydrogenase